MAHYSIPEYATSRVPLFCEEGVLTNYAIFQCILIGLGLQYKTVDDLAKELDLAASQLLGLFNRTIRKLTQLLRAVSWWRRRRLSGVEVDWGGRD